MAASSRERCAAAERAVPRAALLERVRAMPPAPRLRLSGSFDLIAEVKLRSPAVGQLHSGAQDVAARVASYAQAGAAAVSVLTEPTRFDGSLQHLELAVRALAGRAPAMRKDFLVDPYQLIEARAAGAGGVLLILRMLTGAQLDTLLASAAELGLFVLLEAFGTQDIELAHRLTRSHAARARAADAPLLVGVNSRDLVTLQVVPGRLEPLAASLPADVPRVAESGVASAADAARVAVAGYDLALVGSALMQALDPPGLVGAMLRAGRAARGGPPAAAR
ncbi:MAG: indole-3-glycerol-phosphate synthase TrpC [Gammaproteobacteria bacterium]|nr:indole-3-glycerol-phosphate synthase TrpC [Gammaproteobacteria bacterium]